MSNQKYQRILLVTNFFRQEMVLSWCNFNRSWLSGARLYTVFQYREKKYLTLIGHLDGGNLNIAVDS